MCLELQRLALLSYNPLKWIVIRITSEVNLALARRLVVVHPLFTDVQPRLEACLIRSLSSRSSGLHPFFSCKEGRSLESIALEACFFRLAVILRSSAPSDPTNASLITQTTYH